MTYERDYFIHFHDTDNDGKLSIIALMRYFEEIALLQSEELGVGMDFYNMHNVGWLLLKWDITVKHYPGFSENIKIKTIPAAFKGSFANREYYVFDSSENLIAEANTLWIFVDTNIKKPTKIPYEIHEKYLSSNRSDYEFTKLTEITLPASKDYGRQIAVRDGDIDFNGHVNNRRYAEWALELVPGDVKKDLMLSRIRIHYKKEVMITDSIESVLELVHKENETICLHGIIKGGETVCLMETVWLSKN